MFDRFTERARKVVLLARKEAARLNSEYIRTEHILLGLVKEQEGIAARALEVVAQRDRTSRSTRQLSQLG